MLFLLSPAKSLDYDTPAHVASHTNPLFTRRAGELIDVLRRKSPAEIASLMKLSDPLALLNAGRYAAWRSRSTAANSKQAVLAFNGNVYAGLDAKSLDADDLAWAQAHLVILSGLYGVLRPLDRMQPYRLEMGTRLATTHGQTLYEFWSETVTNHLNQRLARDRAPVVVNLASQEYARVVDRTRLKGGSVDCVFEDWTGTAFKVIGVHAKRARGLMVRHAILGRARRVEDLRGFAMEGYVCAPEACSDQRLVFRRRAG